MSEQQLTPNKIGALFKSRRFWIAVIVAVVAVGGKQLGIEVDKEQLENIIKVAGIWILGDSLNKTE
tara:strand:- start:99 stop:296 length:198 start_codon:yes stop_codon:yes gene_type:complete